MSRAPAVPERREAPPPSDTTFIWTGAMLQSLQQCAVLEERVRLEGFYRVVSRLNEHPRNDLLFAFGINSDHMTEPRDIIQVRNHLRCSSVEEASAHLNGIFAQLTQQFNWPATNGRSWLTTLLKVAARRHAAPGCRHSGNGSGKGRPDLGRYETPTHAYTPPLLKDLIPRCRLPTDRERMARLNEALVALASKQKTVFVYRYGIDDHSLLSRRIGQLVERFGFKNESDAAAYITRLWTELHAFGLPPEIDEQWLLDAIANIRSPGSRRHMSVQPRIPAERDPPQPADDQPGGAPHDAPNGSEKPPDTPPYVAAPEGEDGPSADAPRDETREEDIAVAKKPVVLTPREQEALTACRKAMAGSMPPDNIATWARERGFANQWAALRTKGVIGKKSHGVYAFADVAIDGEEQKAPKKQVKEKGAPKTKKKSAEKPMLAGSVVERLMEATLPTDPMKQLHAAASFYTAHPDFLKPELVYLARRHNENVEAQGWQLEMQKHGEVRLVEKPK